MAEQQIELAVSGLQTDPGPFSAAPGGSLIEAQNVAFRRPGVIEPRGPFTYTLDSSNPSDNPISIFEWNGAVYTILDDNTIRKNASSTVATDAASYTKGKTWSAITNDRIEYTTDNGVYTLDSVTDTVSRRAGAPRANGFFTKCVASGTAGLNWLATNYATAYRLVNVRLPLTANLFSAPTDLRIVRNGSGATTYVSLRCYVDATSGMAVGDQVQIYRALKVTPNTSSPADELRLRATLTITSGDLSTGYIDFDDQLDDTSWSGESLYTNESQGGLAFSNYRPYYASDVAFYNNMMFYGQATSPHRVSLNAKWVGVPIGGAAPANYSEALATVNVTPVTFAIGATTVTVPASYISGANKGSIAVGQILTDSTGTPESADATFAANTRVTNVNSATNVVTFTPAAIGAKAGGVITAWDWIEVDDSITTRKIYSGGVPDITKTKLWGDVDGTSGEAAGAPDMERCWAASYASSDFRLYADETGAGACLGIQLTFERVSVGFSFSTAFSVKSSKPLAFDKYCDSVTGVVSSTDGGTNNIAWSKFQLPEAVPLPYFKALGPKDNVVQRLAVLKDTLFVFTTHGMYRFFGTDPDSLIIDLFDPTIRLVDPRMLARSHNVLWAWTTRGVMQISPGGAERIDLPIARDLDDKRTQSFYFQNNNWFMSASDASDVVLIGSDDSGSSHGISYGWNGYAFDVKTSNWAWWNGRRPITAATFATDLSRIPYYGITGGYGKYEFLTASIANPNIFADHVDGPITVLSVTGTSVVLSVNAFWNVAIGDVISDGTGSYWVTSVVDNFNFTIDRSGLSTGNHVVGENCLRRVVWVGNDADDPMLDKSFIKATQPFERARYGRNMTFVFSGYQNTTEYSTITEYAPSGTEFATEKPMIRLNHIPHEVGRDWALKAGFQQSEAGTYWATAGMRLLTRYTGDKVARG